MDPAVRRGDTTDPALRIGDTMDPAVRRGDTTDPAVRRGPRRTWKGRGQLYRRYWSPSDVHQHERTDKREALVLCALEVTEPHAQCEGSITKHVYLPLLQHLAG